MTAIHFASSTTRAKRNASADGRQGSDVGNAHEVELRFSEPLMPRHDRHAGQLLFAGEIVVVVGGLTESDVEDDTARHTDTGHDQHQALHSADTSTPTARRSGDVPSLPIT